MTTLKQLKNNFFVFAALIPQIKQIWLRVLMFLRLRAVWVTARTALWPTTLQRRARRRTAVWKSTSMHQRQW